MKGLSSLFLSIVVGVVLVAIIFKIIKAIIGFFFTIIGAIFHLIIWVISAPFRMLFRFLFR